MAPFHAIAERAQQRGETPWRGPREAKRAGSIGEEP